MKDSTKNDVLMGAALGTIVAGLVMVIGLASASYVSKAESAPVTIPVAPAVAELQDSVPSHRAELEAIRAEIERIKASVMELGTLIHQGPR